MATSICPVCSAVHPDARARNAHMAADHPGTTMTWAGNTATLTSPDGSTRTMTRRDFRTLREAARSVQAPAAPTPTPPPAADPGHVLAAGRPAVTVGGGTPRVEQATGRRVMTRSSVAEAFTREQFAELLREVSQILSDADGAGPAGVFSLSESTLIAGLLHDQLVDMILARFDGDVTRFRAAAAILIILLGKGRVHLLAIQQRGGIKGIAAPIRPLATVPSSLPVAPDMPTPAAAPTAPPWATVPAPAPAPPAPEPPTAPEAPAPAAETGPVLNRESAVDRIFHQ